jgi:hypothetical protein
VAIITAFATVAAAVTTAIATVAALIAFGESLGHGELDVVVDAERQSGRKAHRKGRHGGGLQQPAQAVLTKLAFVPR